MNHQQRIALLICGIAIAATLVYPPYQILGRSLGYGWLFAPENPYAIIDTGQLIVEWVAVLLVGGLVIYLLRGRDAESKLVTVLGALMTIVVVALRVVRGVFGLIVLYQILGMLPVLTWFVNPSGINGEMLAQVFIKVVTLLIALGLFMSSRHFINWLYGKKYGTPHPTLSRRWAL